jgi:hypothetical protein
MYNSFCSAVLASGKSYCHSAWTLVAGMSMVKVQSSSHAVTWNPWPRDPKTQLSSASQGSNLHQFIDLLFRNYNDCNVIEAWRVYFNHPNWHKGSRKVLSSHAVIRSCTLKQNVMWRMVGALGYQTSPKSSRVIHLSLGTFDCLVVLIHHC